MEEEERLRLSKLPKDLLVKLLLEVENRKHLTIEQLENRIKLDTEEVKNRKYKDKNLQIKKILYF